MDNNLNSLENNKRRESTEIKIEDKIYNMLDEVMEEKDSNDSFQYDCATIDDEYKFSRPSTRHCTSQNPNESYITSSNNTQFLSYPPFNRNNKRNMTHSLNQVPNPHFSIPAKNQNINIPRKSAQFSNFDFLNNLNKFAPNYYNNSFNSNNLFQFNNSINLNQSLQSLNSANTPFSVNESFINNNLMGNNIYNENFNGQNNFFGPNNLVTNFNNDVNCINSVPLININSNNSSNDFKRKENRKKTHDVKKKTVNDNYNFNNKNNNSRFLFRKSMTMNYNNNNNNNLYFQNIIMNNTINNNEIVNPIMNSENNNSFFTNNNNINLNNSKIITPKKKYIFNRIHPFKLLGAFKKELTNYSIQNSKFNIKK